MLWSRPVVFVRTTTVRSLEVPWHSLTVTTARTCRGRTDTVWQWRSLQNRCVRRNNVDSCYCLFDIWLFSRLYTLLHESLENGTRSRVLWTQRRTTTKPITGTGGRRWTSSSVHSSRLRWTATQLNIRACFAGRRKPVQGFLNTRSVNVTKRRLNVVQSATMLPRSSAIDLFGWQPVQNCLS